MRYEYEKLAALFEDLLLTELRGHGSHAEFLRSWVPDPDLCKSLINMADAAALENVTAFEVTVSQALFSAADMDELSAALRGSFLVTATPEDGRTNIKFTNQNR